MKLMKKKCKHCGKKFETKVKVQIYCCEECRRKEASKKPKKKKTNKKAIEKRIEDGLVKDAMEAKKLGMTYGQYKVQQYWEEERKKREVRKHECCNSNW